MEETNECDSQPCYNGATCIDGKNNFTCKCPSSWKGRTCQEDVDECLNSTCQNGGTCINLQGSFECECMEDYCGQHCNLNNPCLGVSIIQFFFGQTCAFHFFYVLVEPQCIDTIFRKVMLYGLLWPSIVYHLERRYCIPVC